MNKFIIIIALTLLLKPVLPVLGYALNYDYIINELCENRNNTALNCDGKCHLKKELAKASESGESNSADNRKIKISEQEILFIAAIDNVVFLMVNNLHKITYSYCSLYSYKLSFRIFHPPLMY